MAKFLCLHTLEPASLTRQQVDQMTQAGQKDPVVKGYRSFICASDGKVACVIEAPDKQSASNWFKKMDVPVDSISQIDYEGDRGSIQVLGQWGQQGQQQQSAARTGA